jgi:tetratricopeptide (TPR) repeat protein
VDDYPTSDHSPESAGAQRTGGVDVKADQVSIGGDVVGHDKVTNVEQRVDTGGGAYVAGNVTVEDHAKFTGRDDNSINISDSPGAIVAQEVTVVQQSHVGKRLWVTLGLLAGAIAAILAVITVFRPTPPMPDGFNIAVAPFVEQDAQGTLAVTKDSQALSDWLFAAITREITLLPKSLNFHVRGPDQIRAISGADEKQRADDACKIARQHNATLLIYGVVSTRGSHHQVEPAFCVLNQGFDDGSEITGPDRLGKAVPYTPPLAAPGTLGDVNAELDARVEALQHVVQGLAYYYLSDYDSALNEFRHAADDPNWTEGREVIQLLLGATQLRRYDPLAPLTQRSEILQDASNNFARAYQLNHDYARSYLGLGSVALQQATLDLNHVDAEKLFEASGWYSRGLSSTDQPSFAHIPIKAAFGLGQIYLTGYRSELPGWSAEQAQSYFEQVIQAYEADPLPELRWFAGNAYCQLGYLVGLAQSDWPAMSSKCHRAIDILETMEPNPPSNWIARYWALIDKQLGLVQGVTLEPIVVPFYPTGPREDRPVTLHSLSAHCPPPPGGACVSTWKRISRLRFINLSTAADVEAVFQRQTDGVCEVWRNKGALELEVTVNIVQTTADQKAQFAVLGELGEAMVSDLRDTNNLQYAMVKQVEVYVVDRFLVNHGGGVTYDCGQASAFCILELGDADAPLASTARTNKYLLAHELGHVLGLAHPDEEADSLVPSSPQTIMQPGNPNPNANTLFNCRIFTDRPRELPHNPIIVTTNQADCFRPDPEIA